MIATRGYGDDRRCRLRLLDHGAGRRRDLLDRGELRRGFGVRQRLSMTSE